MRSFALTKSFGLIAAVALAPETGTSLASFQPTHALDHKADTPRGEWNTWGIGHKDALDNQGLTATTAGTSFDTNFGFGKLSL